MQVPRSTYKHPHSPSKIAKKILTSPFLRSSHAVNNISYVRTTPPPVRIFEHKLCSTKEMNLPLFGHLHKNRFDSISLFSLCKVSA